MPTYDYVCKKCGYEFEEFQGISEDPVRICPQCGHMSVERKISGGSGLIFKGSGFYITDYSSGNGKNSEKSKKSQKNKSKSETKSENKSVDSKTD